MASSHKAVVEVHVISAQDLPTCKWSHSHMQTYVRAWLNPKQKLTSRVDTVGNNHPTWNDKFIFAIDGDDIASEFGNPNSAMVFEIYRVRQFRKDKCIGVVRVLLDSLIGKSHGGGGDEDGGINGKCKAFQVRTPAGEPQGILNVGVMSLNGLLNERSIPSFLGSNIAVDYRKLMGEEQMFPQNKVSASVLY